MEVGVAFFHTHQDILLHFRVFHGLNIVGGVRVVVFQVPGPNRFDPVDLTNQSRSLANVPRGEHSDVVSQTGVNDLILKQELEKYLDKWLHLCLRKLQRYNIKKLFAVAGFLLVIFDEVFHRHLTSLLRLDVDDIDEPLGTDEMLHVVDGKVRRGNLAHGIRVVNRASNQGGLLESKAVRAIVAVSTLSMIGSES